MSIENREWSLSSRPVLCACGGYGWMTPGGFLSCRVCGERMTKEGEVREAVPLPPRRKGDYADFQFVCPHGVWRVVRVEPTLLRRRRWVVVTDGKEATALCERPECAAKWAFELNRMSESTGRYR